MAILGGIVEYIMSPHLRRLQLGALVTADIDGILAGEVVGAQLLVEQQTVGAELLLGHSVLALEVGVALAGHGVRAVAIGTLG